MSDWASIEREESRVSVELAQTTAELRQMLARQCRLMNQQHFVRTRAKEMLQRGLDNLDELDAVEEEEQKAAEASTSVDRSSVDRSSVPFDPLAMSPGSWDRWLADAGVEIPPTTQGS